jgi:uncharacterized protein (DUF1330 family)
MVAYLLADVEVVDPGPYAEYRARFDAILGRYRGRILVNGGRCEALEGDWLPRRLVVLEFPTAEHAKRWHASPEYAEILPIRLQHATTRFLTLVEGWPGG